jgi:hypothetical protein
MNQIEEADKIAYVEDARIDCLRTILEFEQEYASREGLPCVDNLPHSRLRPVFEVAAAILLALGIAGMSLAGNFLVFNKMLHWTF